MEEENEPGEWIDMGSIRMWERNPRVNDHAVERMARSITQHGFTSSILVWKEEGRIINGHLRYKAMQQLGRPKIRAVVKSYPSEADAIAAGLDDNLMAEKARWQADGVAELLTELAEDGYDLDNIAIDGSELEALLDDLAKDDGSAGADSRESEPAKVPRPEGVTLLEGDCLGHLKTMKSESVDSLVTDPPYGLSAPPDVREVLTKWMSGEDYESSSGGFMGAEWDSFVPGPRVWEEIYRVMKPGAHGVVFAGTRTVDLMGMALRLAGFEVRDVIHWCYWSGFPKSLDLSKAIDDRFGAVREGTKTVAADAWTAGGRKALEDGLSSYEIPSGDPVTEQAIQWQGWGTALKPAIEPAILIRKPIAEGSTTGQVLATRTGGINIDGCRFRPGDPIWPGPNEGHSKINAGTFDGNNRVPLMSGKLEAGQSRGQEIGRFPANLIHFPKPSRSEREAGCDHLPAKKGHEAVNRKEGSAGTKNPRAGAGRTAEEVRNTHTTVKPIRLMDWLCRLLTPPNGTVLDPFMGSGTTGAAAAARGFGFVGCELLPEHFAICEARIAHWQKVGLE